MKRLASVIISIVFIFTACGRHALEREAFSTAETENETFETKETGNETSEPEENEQPRNEKSPWTTGSIIKWGFTGYITLYVVALASIIIHINYYNKEAYPEGTPQGGQKGEVIKKTYDITATLDKKFLVEEEMMRIFGEIENLDEIKAGECEVSINFNLEIDSTPLRECLFKIRYFSGTITSFLVCDKSEGLQFFCGLVDLFGIRVGRNVKLGRIETSEPIGKLKVRSSKKFVEELIRITAREAAEPVQLDAARDAAAEINLPEADQQQAIQNEGVILKGINEEEEAYKQRGRRNKKIYEISAPRKTYLSKGEEEKIGKTYEITAELNTETELTAQQIFDKMLKFSLLFDLKIDSSFSTFSSEYPEGKRYSLSTECILHPSPVYMIIRIIDRKTRHVIGDLTRIEMGDSITMYSFAPLMLMRITTTKYIKTLKITSDSPEKTEFLNKLILLETEEVE